MRTLSGTLTAAQKSASYYHLWKLTLTRAGQTTRTYYSYDRTLRVSHLEEGDNQQAEVLLDNSDNALTTLDFESYQGVLSYGIRTSAGDEYSDTAPLKAVSQQLISEQGHLYCLLNLIGTSNLMSIEEAVVDYTPPPGDARTIKTLISAIAAGTYTPFVGYGAITVTYDSEDSLLDTYTPADSFNVRVGNSRLRKIKELLELTGSYMRMGADGAIHILDPVISGTSYDYEYVLASAGDHTFYLKNLRKRVVAPNKIIVQSRNGDTPEFTGSATSATSFALQPLINTRQVFLASNAQADSIASAMIEKAELDSEKASAIVPMNVGQEVLDYIKITDARQNDSVVGNIQSLRHICDARRPEFKMELKFGKMSSMSMIPTPPVSMLDIPDIGMPGAGGRGLTDEQIMAMFQAMWVNWWSLFEGVWNLQRSVAAILADHELRISSLEDRMFFLETALWQLEGWGSLPIWVHSPAIDAPTHNIILGPGSGGSQSNWSHSPAIDAPTKSWS